MTSDGSEMVVAVQDGLRPLDGRARWAVIALIAVIVTDALAIGSDLLEIRLMNRVIDGEGVDVATLESNDDRQSVAAVLLLVAYVAAVVFFIRWFNAAYRNLPLLGQTELRFKPGWAIGAWFVPFLNLWRPKQIANDIWRGSKPGAPTLHRDAWQSAPVPALLGVWWAAWIVATYVGNIAARAWFGNDTAEDVRAAATIDAVSLVVDIVAAVLAILVVRALTARQAAHAQQLATSGAAPATIPAA